MGRSRTPKYVVEVESNGPKFTREAWPMKHLGKPLAASAQRYVETFNESLQPGGVNAHISEAAGFLVRVRAARVYKNDGSGDLVAVHADYTDTPAKLFL